MRISLVVATEDESYLRSVLEKLGTMRFIILYLNLKEWRVLMSKYTIIVCDHIHQSGLDLLAKDTEVEMLNLASLPKDELKKELHKADIAITRSSTDVDESFGICNKIARGCACRSGCR